MQEKMGVGRDREVDGRRQPSPTRGQASRVHSARCRIDCSRLCVRVCRCCARCPVSPNLVLDECDAVTDAQVCARARPSTLERGEGLCGHLLPSPGF